MSNRDQFQGICRIAMDGWEFMDIFDLLPLKSREALRNSTFNLCTACVVEAAHKMGDSESTSNILRAIEQIEHQIRCEEVPQA